jgi:hypothetical protein
MYISLYFEPTLTAPMRILYKEYRVLNRSIPLVAILWFSLALAAVLSEVLRHSINNYLIFKYVFWHTTEQQQLFAAYPAYVDINHYGPLFSIVIAPFAVLPDNIGCILWSLANAAFLYFAVMRLKVTKKSKYIIIAVSAIEMMTSTHSVQFNPMNAAWLILTFVLVEEEKDIWATLLIAAGFLIKIYGIAGILFFVFSRHKVKFALSFFVWLIVLFCLPMLWSSPSYIINTYKEWMIVLSEKNQENIAGLFKAGYQDISVMGMVRRITSDASIGNLIFLAPAALLVAIPLLRFKEYVSDQFRLSYLAIVLLTVVIFSSSAESATYVIALPGACIWYILHRNGYKVASRIMLVLLFLLTILSPTDLVPGYLKDHFIRAYSLKALPCFIIWLWLISDVMFKDFRSSASIESHI